MSSSIEAVQPSDRYEIIDVIRGFALFGVLVANMTVVTFKGMTVPMLLELPTGDFELRVTALLRYFVRGKFIFLFSLLFGLGLALQMERAAARGKTLTSTYPRRLAILFTLGVLHLVFIWWGDIVHVYAVAGFAVFLLRRRGDRFLMIVGSLLAVLPLTLLWCWPAIQALLGAETPPGFTPRPVRVAERTAALADGGYLAVLQDNFETYTRPYIRWMTLTNIIASVGIFMLGLVLGRRRLLQDAPQHLGTFWRMLGWGLLIGLPGNLCYVYLRSPEMGSIAAVLVRLPIPLASMALGAAYLAAIVLLYQQPYARPGLSLLAPVGRMALTHYLTHSLCFLLLFTGVGLGLNGKIGMVWAVTIAIAIFLAQIVVSRLWFTRFRFGPVEWLWRRLTYA